MRDIPTKALELLKAKLEAHHQTTLRLTWKSVQCMESLSSNGIETIILKGPILAHQAYGDLNLRQFTDLFILIHKDDFPRVYDLLVNLGYIPLINLDNRETKFLVKSDNHLSFNRQGDILEIHWGIVPQENVPPLSPEQLWRDSRLIHLGDHEFRILSTENTVLYP